MMINKIIWNLIYIKKRTHIQLIKYLALIITTIFKIIIDNFSEFWSYKSLVQIMSQNFNSFASILNSSINFFSLLILKWAIIIAANIYNLLLQLIKF